MKSPPFWLGLLVLCLIIYGRAVTFGFTNWDDPTFITNNPQLQQADLASLQGIFTPGSIPHEVLYIPVTYLSFWVERAVSDLTPAVLHGTNVLLHLASIYLLILLLRARGFAEFAVLTGAAIFALHPLQVEAVAWCSGRKDLLATAFALLCLLSWQHKRPMPSLICMAFAIFAKPTMLVLPLLMLILRPDTWRTQRRALAAACALSFIALALNQSHVQLPADIPPLSTRLAHAPWIAGDTLARFFFIGPNLHFYPWPESRSLGTIIGALLGLAAIAGLFISWRRRTTWLWTSIAFAIIALAPMAQLLIGYREFITADRYTYFPMVAVAIFAAGALSQLPESRSRILPACCLGLLLAMCTLTLPQVNKWRDSVTLWTDYLDSQRSAFGYHQLGRAIRADQGNAETALEALESAVALGGDTAELFYDLGVTYEDFRRRTAALEAYRQVLRRNPNFVEAIINSANILLSRREFANAIILYDRALQFETPYREAILANRALAQAEIDK